MVVPRNWTLDDHRDPDLHLFRPPSEAVDRRRTARRSARPHVDSEQLELGVESSSVGEPSGDSDSVTADADAIDADADADAETWTPAFDDADDLDREDEVAVGHLGETRDEARLALDGRRIHLLVAEHGAPDLDPVHAVRGHQGLTDIDILEPFHAGCGDPQIIRRNDGGVFQIALIANCL